VNASKFLFASEACNRSFNSENRTSVYKVESDYKNEALMVIFV